MKIVTIMGSPRRKGNTAAALGMFEAEMQAAGHEIERVEISRADVKPCISCWKCAENQDAPGCVRKDGGPALFDMLIAADAVVYSTPLYCWGFSAQMKALIDRHVCMVKGFESGDHRSFLGGKKTALLVTCEGPVEKNADLIKVLFDRMAGVYALMDVVGKYIVTGCGLEPGKLPDEAPELMRKMAGDFSGTPTMGQETDNG